MAEGTWHHPIVLKTTADFAYELSPHDAKQLPNGPALYVFGRFWSDNATPLYIGRTLTLQDRICKQHLNSLTFMRALRDFPNGDRFLMYCTFAVPASRVGRTLDIAERGLIDKALTEGHELINIQGTRTPAHQFTFHGNSASHQICGKRMLVRKGWFGR